MKKRISFLMCFIMISGLIIGQVDAKKKKLKIKDLSKAKAPIETKNGVLFTFKNKDAQNVSIAGTFNSWDMNKNELKKNQKGLWYTIIPLVKGKIEYKFVVNKKDWIQDPKNKNKIKDEYGGGFKSVFEVKKGVNLGGVMIEGNKVVFKYLKSDANSVAVAGSFNQWNTKANPLKKDDNGFWILELELIPGTYQYKYVINGNDWLIDPINPNTVDDGLGGKNSTFEVK